MFETIFTDLGTDNLGMDIGSTIVCVLVAAILGIIISVSYKILTNSKSSSSSFVLSLTVLPIIVTVVIMLVGNNVARAFSMAGAFTLVRFRSTPGDSKDITYVFLAMAIGLATGLGFLTLAAVIAVLVSVLIVVFHSIGFTGVKAKSRQLKITVPEDMNFDGAFDDLFIKYTKSYSLTRVKTTNMGTLFELTYEIQMKDEISQKEFIDEIRCRNGNLNISIAMMENSNIQL